MTPPSTWKLREQDLEPVACPACASHDHERLARTDRYDMDIQTVGCRACGLVFTNPQPSGQALDRFYRDHYRDFYLGEREPSLNTIRRQRKDERCAEAVAFMGRSSLLKPDMKALDVGASEGVLLRALGEAVASSRFAVEPNAAYGAFAVAHAGCRWFDSLESLRAAGEGGFDLITMVHVFEHVKQPVQELRRLAGLLAPGGAIYVDVPDVTTYGRLGDLHIAHLFHFGPDSLRPRRARRRRPRSARAGTPRTHHASTLAARGAQARCRGRAPGGAEPQGRLDLRPPCRPSRLGPAPPPLAVVAAPRTHGTRLRIRAQRAPRAADAAPGGIEGPRPRSMRQMPSSRTGCVAVAGT